MPYTDTSINNLVIHKFPSTTLFNTAVNAGSIAATDISFVEGANEQRVAANNIVLSASNQAYIYVDGATKTIRLLENYAPEGHDHLSITSKGAIKGSPSYGVTTATNDQVAIASGDRLVIGDWSNIGADAGYPLKLSTISFAANGTRFLREDGTWGTPAGGGGGGGSSVYAWDVTLATTASSFIQIDNTTYTIKLPENIPSGWIGASSVNAASGNHTHGDITSTGTITAAAVTAASGDYIVLCDSSNSNKIVKSNIQIGLDDKKFLSHDGKWDKPYLSNLADVTITNGASGNALLFTGTSWVNGTISSGVSTHNLLDSTVHTDTITASPSTGAIIVGSSNKWTIESFDTFAAQHGAVPLVGHFDSTTFSAWFNANLSAILNGGTFYDNPTTIVDDNPGLQPITFTDITISDVISAMQSGRPTYIIGDASLQGIDNFKFVFQPSLDITSEDTPPQHGIMFNSACGYEFIGGAQAMYSQDFDGQGNPGIGLILLPRMTGSDLNIVRNGPTDEKGFIKNSVQTIASTQLPVLKYTSDGQAGGYIIASSDIVFGSSTSTYLRNDGTWATPAGGGGGTQINWVEWTYN